MGGIRAASWKREESGELRPSSSGAVPSGARRGVADPFCRGSGLPGHYVAGGSVPEI